MIKFILSGWFLINTYGVENDGTHNYYLQDKVNNYHISANLTNPLSEKSDNKWIKLHMEVECEKVLTMAKTHRQKRVYEYFCHTEQIREIKCNKNNSSFIGGSIYC